MLTLKVIAQVTLGNHDPRDKLEIREVRCFIYHGAAWERQGPPSPDTNFIVFPLLNMLLQNPKLEAREVYMHACIHACMRV